MFNLEGRAMRTRDVGGSAWRGSESSWGSGCLLRMVYVEVATVGLVDKNIYLCSCAIMHVQAPLPYYIFSASANRLAQRQSLSQPAGAFKSFCL